MSDRCRRKLRLGPFDPKRLSDGRAHFDPEARAAARIAQLSRRPGDCAGTAGAFVKSTGYGVIAEFRSVVEATRCAIELIRRRRRPRARGSGSVRPARRGR
jgi:hypothetical protein